MPHIYHFQCKIARQFSKFVFNKCKLSVRRILSQSNNSVNKRLYKITENENIHDQFKIMPRIRKKGTSIKKLAKNLFKN